MDRRAALGLATLATGALAATPARACSLAVDSPEVYAARPAEIASLFRKWFERDELGFLGTLLGPRPGTGATPKPDFVRRAIDASPDRETKRLYKALFTDRSSFKQVLTITAVGDRAFVAVNEQKEGGIGPDCSNMPTLHLFMVGYRFGRPGTVRQIESGTWTGHGQIAHWSG